MGDLKEAPAVHFNFPLQSFSLYITFKRGLPLPVSLFLRNRGGLVNGWGGSSLEILQVCSCADQAPCSWGLTLPKEAAEIFWKSTG